jgi:hypothetical protein
MRKSFGVMLIVLGLFGIVLERNRSLGQVQKNSFCNGSVCLQCGTCTDDPINGGCWVWSGGPICFCNGGTDTCDPNQVQVFCTGTFYLGGACSGFNCGTPNSCCVNSGVLTKTQTTRPYSCVP